jgi:uncharacterized membrane protein YhaH (DUF805 family)
MFNNPFSFYGRIRRTEYGISIILCNVAAFIIGLFIVAASLGEGIMFILLIPIYWFSFAQGAKRCHDRGNSGWYQIIPFYGLWMLFADSDNGPNEYGLNPKGIGNPNNSGTSIMAEQSNNDYATPEIDGQRNIPGVTAEILDKLTSAKRYKLDRLIKEMGKTDIIVFHDNTVKLFSKERWDGIVSSGASDKFEIIYKNQQQD